MSKSLEDLFREDPQGRKFADVLSDPRVPKDVTFAFFSDKTRHARMIRSEMDHRRPPLAGVIVEFEEVPEISAFLSKHDAHTTMRYRQAIGVIVRIVMGQYGWIPAANDGSLGTRAKVEPGTATPGAYMNESGLSIWFTKAKRYVRDMAKSWWDGICNCGK